MHISMYQASAPVADLSGTGAAPLQVAEQEVMRALPSYGTYGGYRYRRFSGDS